MKKKISIVAIIFIGLLSSCNKSDSDNTTATAEGIFSKQLNLSITAALTSPNYYRVMYGFSLLDDSIVALTDNMYLSIYYNPNGNSFNLAGTFNQEIGYEEGAYTNFIIKTYAVNETINATSSSYDDGNSGKNIDGYENNIASGYTDGNILPGGDDKYIGVRLKLSDNKVHYGWMLLNFSANGKTVTVIEYAYNKVANASIKAGQK